MSEKKLTFFDIVTNICSSKTKLEWDDISQVYNPYMINKALSNMRDTVLIANEANQHYNLTKEMHYDFLFNIISKKKRYGKWNKQMDDKDAISLIMEYYNYSYSKAKEVQDLVDLKFIKMKLDKGGRSKK